MYSATTTISKPEEMTPREIVTELDKYIVGQQDAKKNVAIALRNRWRRRNAAEEIRDEIIPNNILMIGPTGVGKTEIARRLAKLSGAPFIKVEATKFTEVGYVGRDVDSMIRDLVDIAINMVREEQTETLRERAQELAEERILDILFPMPRKPGTTAIQGAFPMQQSESNGENPDKSEDDSVRRTREKFRKKLAGGELEDREIEVEASSDNTPMVQVFGPMGMEEMGMNLQDIFGEMGNRKRKKRRVKISEARAILSKEEAQKLIDMDKAKREAIERVENSGIVFIDEIDKVAGRSGKRGGPDVSREGVQRDLLPMVEGSNVTTKHGMVKTDHILFIAGGAFHVSKPSDLIPEMQGRFPIRVELQSLDEEDFYRILTEPRNALLKQYAALLASENVRIEFTDGAVRRIAAVAAEVNADVENIGARRLHTILTTLLEDILFETPDAQRTEILIDEEMVNDTLNAVVENRDLSQYIL